MKSKNSLPSKKFLLLLNMLDKCDIVYTILKLFFVLSIVFSKELKNHGKRKSIFAVV